MLGICRVQRHRLPRHREPAAPVHGRTEGAAPVAQHHQLPPGAYEEVCHPPGKEELGREGHESQGDVGCSLGRERAGGQYRAVSGGIKRSPGTTDGHFSRSDIAGTIHTRRTGERRILSGVGRCITSVQYHPQKPGNGIEKVYILTMYNTISSDLTLCCSFQSHARGRGFRLGNGNEELKSWLRATRTLNVGLQIGQKRTSHCNFNCLRISLMCHPLIVYPAAFNKTDVDREVSNDSLGPCKPHGGEMGRLLTSIQSIGKSQ